MFESIEWLAVAWAISLLAAGALTLRALAAVRLRHLRALHCDERGSYTLSFVMTLPVYIVVMLFVLETTLLLVTKIGTLYAAFAGARAAIVQYPSSHPSDARQKTVAAARKAFVPFANGVERHREGRLETSDPLIEEYIKAYAVYASRPGSAAYLRAKYLYTNDHVKVDCSVPDGQRPAKWNSDIKVTVTCDYALHFPIFGRLLGLKQVGSSFYYEITSSATLQNEGPKNDEQELGISYASP
jgi:hypothetical protein